jgi:hypothetical protein
MNDIVEEAIRGCGRNIDPKLRQKMNDYVRLLASTGKPRRQLLEYAEAYLQETLEPNPRYSGC